MTGKGTNLGEGGKTLSKVRGKSSKVGEPCTKVRLGQVANRAIYPHEKLGERERH